VKKKLNPQNWSFFDFLSLRGTKAAWLRVIKNNKFFFFSEFETKKFVFLFYPYSLLPSGDYHPPPTFISLSIEQGGHKSHKSSHLGKIVTVYINLESITD
jgi:hypothetical protein